MGSAVSEIVIEYGYDSVETSMKVGTGDPSASEIWY